MTRKNRVKHSNGYWLIPCPEHPYANNDGYVPEHRLVIETIIGRFVNPKVELVHHKDTNKQNNNPSNLQLVSFKEHRRIHDGWIRQNGKWWKPCKACNRVLLVTARNFHRRRSGKFFHTCVPCARKNALSFYHNNNGMERQRERRRRVANSIDTA